MQIDLKEKYCFKHGDLIKIKDFKGIGIVLSFKIIAVKYGYIWIELKCFINNKFKLLSQTLDLYQKYCNDGYFRRI